ncbi:Hypothetical Protein SLY_0752 [Strawberry lethal yellows phytoplasma (CPA) str. NZSb11]|uniref:Uncharacterized protein n=1 Tax=Strawberry lethal yellows phytoplasma (CPA) str. NZSb11 TaxID=980422 RepID=R4S1K8_PHYAS|nr:Hypothetical Protein SLY_0752 [Strawberry lethal yellows phytoplasma (CPA) str. NZSb11]
MFVCHLAKKSSLLMLFWLDALFFQACEENLFSL